MDKKELKQAVLNSDLYSKSEKLLINVTADNVVRLLPPLVINQSEAEQLVAILARLIKQFLSE